MVYLGNRVVHYGDADIQREGIISLKPDTFEGMRFEINKPINQHFFLSHSLFMGNMEMQTGGRQIIKTPVGQYEFGATVVNEAQSLLMMGRIGTDGRLSGRVKYDITNWLGLKLHCQLSNNPNQSQVMMDTDLKGGDWNAQVKVGAPGFLGLNYFQSITPKLSAGGEFFWLPSNAKSGVGLAVRHQGDKHVATCQIATTGIMNAQYTHKVGAWDGGTCFGLEGCSEGGREEERRRSWEGQGQQRGIMNAQYKHKVGRGPKGRELGGHSLGAWWWGAWVVGGGGRGGGEARVRQGRWHGVRGCRLSHAPGPHPAPVQIHSVVIGVS